MAVNFRELAAGGVFVVIGAGFAGNALLNLRVGSALSMGPGYFPLILGTVLIGLGAAIALLGQALPSEPLGRTSWRSVALVVLSIVVFGLTARALGFAPSLFVSVFLASMSSREVGIAGSAAVAAVLTVFSVLVFVYALGLPYPLLGPWLRF